MGYGEVGGNGSVEWAIEVEDPKWVHSQSKVPKGHRQGGADQGGAPGQMFTIRIEVPAGAARDALAAALQKAADDARQPGITKVEFYLPIEKQNRDQIQILWPDV